MPKTSSGAANASTPLRLLGSLPGRVLAPPLVTMLNIGLRPLIEDGELDFLQDRVVAVAIEGLGLRWNFTMGASRRLRVVAAEPEVLIAGNVRDLLLLAARREDPDTLFFQRRLRLEGDTELGLQVKNVMDRLDLSDLPPPLRWALLQAAEVAARLP